MTTATATTRPIKILLVEDSEGDAMLVTEALSEADAPTDVVVSPTAEFALGMLEDGYSPDIVLLDLNLPGMTGLEFLREVKRDAAHRVTPIIVLTTSASRADVTASYDNYASSYVTKPLAFADFSGIMRSIDDFWLGVVELPRP